MKICICCSSKYFPVIEKFVRETSGRNKILTPTMDFSGELNEASRKNLAELHHKKIASSEAVYIYNPDGEIGKNVTLEVGFALALNKKIYAFKKVGDAGIDCFIEKFFTLKDLEKV